MKVYNTPVKYEGRDATIESWYERTHGVWYAALFAKRDGDGTLYQVFTAEYAMTQETAIRYVKQTMECLIQ